MPDHFRFVVKVPRIITHYKKLQNCSSLIQQFETNSGNLKYKRALMLLQLPPNMPYDLEVLKESLLAFKHRHTVVVEFRHSRWITDEVKDLLKELNCIFCATDSPIMHLQGWVTSEIAYIRLHGRTNWFDYNYSHKELQSIATYARNMKKTRR